MNASQGRWWYPSHRLRSVWVGTAIVKYHEVFCATGGTCEQCKNVGEGELRVHTAISGEVCSCIHVLWNQHHPCAARNAPPTNSGKLRVPTKSKPSFCAHCMRTKARARNSVREMQAPAILNLSFVRSDLPLPDFVNAVMKNIT